MANFFDQFDSAPSASTVRAASAAPANYFDQFDPHVAPPTGSLWENIQSIPGGMVQGLANAASASGQAAQLEMGEPVDVPGPEETARLLEQHVTGPLPNTGLYGRRVGEALGNPATYVAPGGALAGAGAGIVSGIGAAAGEQLAGPSGGFVGGMLAPVAGSAAVTGVANRAARAARAELLNTETLTAAANQNYRNARGLGVEFHPEPIDGVANKIWNDLWNDGFRPINVGKTWGALDELKDIARAKTVTLDDIEAVRKAFQQAGANPLEGAERAASRRAISILDDFMARPDPVDIAINPHFANRLAREMQQARGNWAAAKRAETIEGREERAALAAGSTGSGANINNAIRQQMAQILRSPRLQRGFSQDELDQMKRIVAGTTTGNIGRYVGKLAPTGVVSAWPSVAAGIGAHAAGMTPLAAAVPIVGFAGKTVGDLSTARQLRLLDQMVRERSPLARRLAPLSLRPWSTVPAYALPGLTNPFSGP